jgi:c-di-GMP phosphodiesterase
VLVDTFFARQPIFDRSRRVCGYELLYRSGPVDRAGFTDGVSATAQVLANAFADVDSPDLLGGLPAFVNLPRELIVSRAILAFPPDRVAVEVLEDVTPDAEVMAALAELRAAGYRIALDDYGAGDPRRLLVPFADIVKVDLMATAPDDLLGMAATLRSAGVTLLAEKVEDLEEYKRCFDLGFSMFQGFFFARPELMSGRRVDEGRSRLTGLLGELHRPGVSIEQVAEAVERHPDFAHHLLRVLNSAAMGLTRQVDSIRQAVVMLGIRRVTELATVLVLASNDHKPRELLNLALTRARMCSVVADRMGRVDADSFFTVGALSVLDALADRPLPELVEPLPLSDDVKSALIHRVGIKGELLDAAIAYERAEWERLTDTDLDASTLAHGYLEALEWSTQMMATV